MTIEGLVELDQHELIQLLEPEMDAMSDFGQQLADYYLQWTQKVDCVLDKTKPRNQRLAAMQWIDEQVGEPLTKDDRLDAVCEQLRRDLEL